MHALIVYESMYGNTRKIADAIAAGLHKRGADVSVVTAAQVTAEQTAAADLLVVGGPTHAWTMSRPATRRSAVEVVRKSPGGALTMIEGAADGTGVREWIAGLADQAIVKPFAAFDTRRHAPLGLSGSAARAIDKRLRRMGWRSVRRPQCFYVAKDDHLEPDEQARASGWGAELADV